MFENRVQINRLSGADGLGWSSLSKYIDKNYLLNGRSSNYTTFIDSIELISDAMTLAPTTKKRTDLLDLY